MSLKSKHKAALVLLGENRHTIKDIAKAVGMNHSYLNDIMHGKSNTGNVGQEFSAEYRKIEQELDKRIRRNVKEALDLSSSELRKWLQKIQAKRYKSEKELKLIKDIQMVLSKSRPHIEIGSLSYTKGLSAEDIFNEFKRLTGVARASLIRERVPIAESGRPGKVLVASGPGDTAQEEPEDTSIPTLRSPEELSREQFPSEGDIRGE